jgi:hypothetical protein
MGDTPKQMSFKDIKVIDLTTEMELKPGTNETLRAIARQNHPEMKLTKYRPKKPGKLKAGGLKEATARLKAQGLKKGGKKKKFPDLSGDGKVTMKDILMGRGIIKKTKKKTKKSKP